MTDRSGHSPPSNPAELRQIFGENLRKLAKEYDSVAGLCRKLEINRTQFNRYLSGESFPRPDILHRIATFFGKDARILLESVDQIEAPARSLLHHPVLKDFFGDHITKVPQILFPNGLYQFTRPSFVEPNKFVQSLALVWREGDYTFIRALESKAAFKEQGLPFDTRSREVRGAVMAQDEGITLLISRRGATTCSFGFLNKVPSFQNNIWVGFTIRTIPEGIDGGRVVRMVFEHLDHNTHAILRAARSVGFTSEEGLTPFHRKLLRITEPFK